MFAAIGVAASVLDDVLLYGRPCRAVLGVLLALVAGLCFTPQAQDALVTLGQGTSAATWLGFVSSTAWLGLNAWFWSSFILGVRLAHAGPGPADATHARHRQRASVRAAVPRLLGLLPFLGVSAALLGAAGRIPEDMRGRMSAMESGTDRLQLAAAGIALLGVGLVAASCRWQAWRLARGAAEGAAPGALPAPGIGRAAALMFGVSTAVAAAGMALYGAAPVATARILQPGPTILCAAAGLICGGTILAYLGTRWRLPLLPLVLVGAFALATLRDADIIADNHDIRRVAGPLPVRPDLEAAFSLFLAASESRYPAPQPIPVVLAAASGGGLAAAFWTATVLGDLADASPDLAGQLFGISGVSGGALGALEFAAALGGEADCGAATHPPAAPNRLRGCLQLALDADFLAPAIGSLLYPDLMQRFLPLPVVADRAVAIERAWEAQWQSAFHDDRLGRPFLELWPPHRPWPALFLNGTSLLSGGRVVTSNLALQPAAGAGSVPALAADIVDLLALAGADVPASTAANNSARFPYIGPFGIVRPRGAGSPAVDAIGDGGYFENFGASTLLDVLDALDRIAQRRGRAVRFVVLQIVGSADGGIVPGPGHGAREPSVGVLPRGIAGPIETLLQTRTARGLNATESLARRTLALGGTYIPIRLGLSPTGATAPLGWSLSPVARDVIDGQWTPDCRDRVLARMALAPDSASADALPPTGFRAQMAASACVPIAGRL